MSNSKIKFISKYFFSNFSNNICYCWVSVKMKINWGHLAELDQIGIRHVGVRREGKTGEPGSRT